MGRKEVEATLIRNIIRNWKQRHPKTWTMIQLFFIYAWLSKLPKTDSFFSVYCAAAISGIFCILINSERKKMFSPKMHLGIYVFSAVFSLSVIAGNYMLFLPMSALRNLLDISLCFVGGCIICIEILTCLINIFPIKLEISDKKYGTAVFCGCLASIVILELSYLFTTRYPAIINYDTLYQIKQVMGLAPYDNWSPYWHTRTIGFFLTWGYRFFDDWNAALAFYEVWQILFIGSCIAYVLTTLYQAGVPRGFFVLAFGLYVLLPYNIAFMVTIGKDVLFGAGLLLMQTALYRILTRVGKLQILNYIVFVIGSIGFSLWRTNGWYTYLVTGLILIPLFRKKFKPVLYTMAGVLMVCWVLLNPYLKVCGVSDGPVTETMGVPLQQVAKVIVNEREIPEGDAVFLQEIFDFELVKEQFAPNTVDPIKFSSLRGSTDFFKVHMGDFLQTWIRLGIKYPGDYLTAWIDLSRGYWTGGYSMGVNDKEIPDNDIGLFNSSGEPLIASVFLSYFRCIEDAVILEPLKSIGFVVWLILIFWWSTTMKRRFTGVIALPALIIMVGLWFGAPVFAEFRYSYPIFLISPLILFASIFQTKGEMDEQKTEIVI